MSARTLAWLTALLAACGSIEAAPAPPVDPGASSAAIRWVAVRDADSTALLEAPAQVLAPPGSRVVITPPLRARILAIRVQPGAEVAAGAPLVEVALPEAAAAAAAYLAAVDELDAYARRAAQLEALRQEGLTRAADLAAVELELARLRGSRDVAATALRAAGLGPAQARDLAASGGRTTLRATTAGFVTAVRAVTGATQPADEPLVELATGGGARLEARLPRPLPADARAELVVAGAAPVAARLISIAPVREPDGATLAWFELAAPLPPGTLGTLRGRLGPGSAVTIPAAALGRDARGSYVWRRDQAASRRVPVQVLATSGADALVLGLGAGDQVAAVASALASPAAGAQP